MALFGSDNLVMVTSDGVPVINPVSFPLGFYTLPVSNIGVPFITGILNPGIGTVTAVPFYGAYPSGTINSANNVNTGNEIPAMESGIRLEQLTQDTPMEPVAGVLPSGTDNARADPTASGSRSFEATAAESSVSRNEHRALFDEIMAPCEYVSFHDFSDKLAEYMRRSGFSFVIENCKRTGSYRKVKKGRGSAVVMVHPTPEARYYWIRYRCQHNGRRPIHEHQVRM